MSGHSKWANIKRRKAVVDAQRGKNFSKLAREITVAARFGPDPSSNFRLKAALDKARQYNLPAENVERAIQRGSGSGADDQVEEILYEGYGPGGVAVLLECMTDNRNRTAAEIRHIFAKRGGNLGEAGCVAWLFERKAVLHIEASPDDENDVLDRALEAGAEDVAPEEDGFTVIGAPETLQGLSAAFESGPGKVRQSGLERLPKTRIEVSGKDAEHLLDLVDTLEDHDDVQAVWSNFDLSDEEWARVDAEASG